MPICVLLWQRVLRTWPLWLTFTLSVSQIVSLCPGYLLPLPALIVPALRSLSHSLTLRSLLTLPCFRWELVGRTLPPPGTNHHQLANTLPLTYFSHVTSFSLWQLKAYSGFLWLPCPRFVFTSWLVWFGLVWSGRSASSSSARAVVTALLAAAPGR